MEIRKILEDTREIQKEINTLEGQLDRCFSIADETLFRVCVYFCYLCLVCWNPVSLCVFFIS